MNKSVNLDFFNLIAQEQNFVGYLYEIDYENAKILTNDYYKNQVKGIPHGCFLMAIYHNEINNNKEGLLLRVVGTSDIPQKKEIVESITDNYISQKTLDSTLSLDSYTKNFYQYNGLSCRVLGTFFYKNNELEFGTDIESFLSSHNYQIYKPKKQELDFIINQNMNIIGDNRESIGTLRYSSSNSHDKNGEYSPEFSVSIDDLIAKKTAFFGMTRTGKSNTMKIFISAIEKLNSKSKHKIGQIIFDINGEYTFTNKQDNGCIYDKFKDRAIRYSVCDKKAEKYEDVVSIQYNFYNDETLQESFDLLCEELERDYEKTQYINDFINVRDSMFNTKNTDDEERREKIDIYKCILYKAKFEADDEIKKYLKEKLIFFANNESAFRAKGKDYEALYNILIPRQNKTAGTNLTSISGGYRGGGYKALFSINKFHSLHGGSIDYRKHIDSALREGKMVLVDLSTTPTEIQRKYIDRLCFYIFENSMTEFTNGEDPKSIQMYFEEAHNIFPKDDKNLKNIYNRLAKESSKLNIGISYSTQEVSAIAPSILKNTQNWFISHLNNKNEMQLLEKYYDFSDFSQSIIRNNDIGFVRAKIYSNNFIIPIQINFFEP
ncbi:ATP-binding protein [Campylobacter sp. MIT 12-8780]|uniref:ATP-binding protein n=1 Tax=unclassified Campylobacter TaxID=2593542 RepID=UPI00115EB2E0|nr:MULTISPECIES: DUF87 domain-containing protein [unclassified Campylobacter]NDJ27820.1 DUF87 domain-containing protein [Campylobacter sp. MIT 19-121]TQR40978.1 ATP-binding protein [Campylobacter sp. MIT 12-8780]